MCTLVFVFVFVLAQGRSGWLGTEVEEVLADLKSNNDTWKKIFTSCNIWLWLKRQDLLKNALLNIYQQRISQTHIHVFDFEMKKCKYVSTECTFSTKTKAIEGRNIGICFLRLWIWRWKPKAKYQYETSFDQCIIQKRQFENELQ